MSFNSKRKPFFKPPYNPIKLTPKREVDSETISLIKMIISEGNLNKLIKTTNERELNLNIVDEENNTPIHMVLYLDESRVSNMDKLEMIKFLYKQGCPIDSFNKKNITPLHLAVKTQDNELVEYILKHTNLINHKDNSNLTPLHYAIMGKSINCIDENNEPEQKVKINQGELDNELYEYVRLVLSKFKDENDFRNNFIRLLQNFKNFNNVFLTEIYDIDMEILNNEESIKKSNNLNNNEKIQQITNLKNKRYSEYLNLLFLNLTNTLQGMNMDPDNSKEEELFQKTQEDINNVIENVTEIINKLLGEVREIKRSTSETYEHIQRIYEHGYYFNINNIDVDGNPLEEVMSEVEFHDYFREDIGQVPIIEPRIAHNHNGNKLQNEIVRFDQPDEVVLLSLSLQQQAMQNGLILEPLRLKITNGQYIHTGPNRATIEANCNAFIPGFNLDYYQDVNFADFESCLNHHCLTSKLNLYLQRIIDILNILNRNFQNASYLLRYRLDTGNSDFYHLIVKFLPHILEDILDINLNLTMVLKEYNRIFPKIEEFKEYLNKIYNLYKLNNTYIYSVENQIIHIEEIEEKIKKVEPPKLNEIYGDMVKINSDVRSLIDIVNMDSFRKIMSTYFQNNNQIEYEMTNIFDRMLLKPKKNLSNISFRQFTEEVHSIDSYENIDNETRKKIYSSLFEYFFTINAFNFSQYIIKFDTNINLPQLCAIFTGDYDDNYLRIFKSELQGPNIDEVDDDNFEDYAFENNYGYFTNSIYLENADYEDREEFNLMVNKQFKYSYNVSRENTLAGKNIYLKNVAELNSIVKNKIKLQEDTFAMIKYNFDLFSNKSLFRILNNFRIFEENLRQNSQSALELYEKLKEKINELSQNSINSEEFSNLIINDAVTKILISNLKTAMENIILAIVNGQEPQNAFNLKNFLIPENIFKIDGEYDKETLDSIIKEQYMEQKKEITKRTYLMSREDNTKLTITNSHNLGNYNFGGVNEEQDRCLTIDSDIIKKLINKGANINDKDAKQMTPIFYALMNLDEERIRILIENGAKVSTPKSKNSNNLSPLEYMIKTLNERNFNSKLFYGNLGDKLEKNINSIFNDKSPFDVNLMFKQIFYMLNHSFYLETKDYNSISVDEFKLICQKINNYGCGICNDKLSILMIPNNDLNRITGISTKDKPLLKEFERITEDMLQKIKLLDDYKKSINELRKELGEVDNNDLTGKLILNKRIQKFEQKKSQLKLELTNLKKKRDNLKQNLDDSTYKNKLNLVKQRDKFYSNKSNLTLLSDSSVSRIVKIYKAVFNNFTNNVSMKKGKFNYNGFEDYGLYVSLWYNFLKSDRVNSIENIIEILGCLEKEIIKNNDMNVLEIIHKLFKKDFSMFAENYFNLPQNNIYENYALHTVYKIISHVVRHHICSKLYLAILNYLASYLLKTIPKDKYTKETKDDLIKEIMKKLFSENDSIMKKLNNLILGKLPNIISEALLIESDEYTSPKEFTDLIIQTILDYKLLSIKDDSEFISSLRTNVLDKYNESFSLLIPKFKQSVDNFISFINHHTKELNILTMLVDKSKKEKRM